MKRNMILAMTALALTAGLAVGCAAPQPSGELTPVRLLLTYQPDVQFAPFYVGIEQGIFAEHGLDVSIEHLAESDVTRLVASGEADFGIVSGEQVLLARAQDLPVVYVFQWYHDFPVAVASKSELGIETPADLAGHSVGVPLAEGASYIGLEALLASANLTDDDIDLQVTGFTQVETLLADRVDAVVVYATNEPIQLEAQGVAVNLISVSDYADLVSNGLIAGEQTIADDPELVRAMVAALAESVQYTIDNPDEAFEISAGYVEGLNDPAMEDAQREVLARSIDLWRAEPLGQSDLAAWREMMTLLVNMGLLPEEQTLETAFTNDFLP